MFIGCLNSYVESSQHLIFAYQHFAPAVEYLHASPLFGLAFPTARAASILRSTHAINSGRLNLGPSSDLHSSTALSRTGACAYEGELKKSIREINAMTAFILTSLVSHHLHDTPSHYSINLNVTGIGAEIGMTCQQRYVPQRTTDG